MKKHFKIKLYDWLWWNIGNFLWKKSARLHGKSEVARRLNWMGLDNNGKFNNDEISNYLILGEMVRADFLDLTYKIKNLEYKDFYEIPDETNPKDVEIYFKIKQ